MTSIKKLISLAIWKISAHKHSKPAFNVNCAPLNTHSKRALLVYLTAPFYLRDGHFAFRYHQSMQQAKQIASILDEFGYIVDAAGIHDRGFRPSCNYDLIINHRSDFTGLEQGIGPNTIKIYLASGTNHVRHNISLKRRADQLRLRRGCQLTNLIWDDEEMPFLTIADAIATFGNELIADSWRSTFTGPVYPFHNYGVCQHLIPHRNFPEARKHFLFFGSRQQLGKGLDLLLEVFSKNPDLHLHVCSKYRNEPDFCACYENELFHTPNIHPWGWIDIGGSRFRKLIEQCAFVILPSCSEGSPGSVTNSLSVGLIPILTRESGLDIEGFGFTFSDDSIETIEETVRSASNLAPEALDKSSQLVRQISAELYSVEAFSARWRAILTDIHSTFIQKKIS